MSENKKWFVAYTRPGQERKLAEILTRKKIENYCPLNTVMRPSIDRRKPVQEALFNCYLFVRIFEKDIPALRGIDGIVNMVFWLGKPAVIDAAEIAAMKEFLHLHATVKLGKVQVRANNEAGQDHSSLVLNEDFARQTKNKFVKLMLPSLGYLMIAESKQPVKEVLSSDIIGGVESRSSL